MSLAATLAADGVRPASFLPSIKCSSCGDEIEISAMGEHICSRAPPSPKAAPASLTNPFTLRQMNASNSRPTQPSPLQFNSPSIPKPPSVPLPAPAPQTRVRAPTLGSGAPPTPKAPRTAPPNINPDAANKPFLAPQPRSESPVSPATSASSKDSNGRRPQVPLRSMTSPMPRLWDPRPPSPELSANLDCAFPPFPFSESNGSNSRPGSSNGRGTPTGSDQGSVRAGSRQDSRFPTEASREPRSPGSTTAERPAVKRANTLKRGQFDTGRRRPSNASMHDLPPGDNRRRPSMSGQAPPEMPPPLPTTDFSQMLQKSTTAKETEVATSAAEVHDGKLVDKKIPPGRPSRPSRPDEPDPSSAFTNGLNSQPATTSPLQSTKSSSAEPALNGNDALPPRKASDDSTGYADLEKVQSAPAPQDAERRPQMPALSKTEPTRVPQILPQRSASRNDGRMDYRLQDAPPVPKPVQLTRSNSMHKPSASDSSTTSSVNSNENSNSSSVQSPVGSAASSVDMFSPISYEDKDEDRDMRVPGLNIKNQQKPGMRAEQPKGKSPPRNFARPSPPAPINLHPSSESKQELEEAPKSPFEQPPTPGNWPLESPMDPSLQNGRIEADVQDAQPKPLALVTSLSPVNSHDDAYDPYRSRSPMAPTPQQQPRGQARSRSKTMDRPIPRPFAPMPMPRSQSPQPLRSATFDHEPPQRPQILRSATFASDGNPQFMSPAVPMPPPPIPEDPASRPPPLARRPTVAGNKSACRGCGHAIEGKSVKAADGRLTGRWHKACFVCQACQAPFTTADFYVIGNQPFCEQHYHERNGSCCHGCQRGIEGQYLETTGGGPQGGVQRKFHPKCFTCVSCRVVLADDYFEILGRVYCERHALAAMRGPPQHARPGGAPPRTAGSPLVQQLGTGASGLRAERRSTRLMMMS